MINTILVYMYMETKNMFIIQLQQVTSTSSGAQISRSCDDDFIAENKPS